MTQRRFIYVDDTLDLPPDPAGLADYTASITKSGHLYVVTPGAGAGGGSAFVLGAAVIGATVIEGATYSITAADLGNVVEMDSSTAATLTVPLHATLGLPVGATVEVYQAGAGQVTIAGEGGVTLRAPRGLKTAEQYATLTLRHRATDEWVVSGDATT